MSRITQQKVEGAILLGVALALSSAGCDENLSHPQRDKATGTEIEPLTCVPNLDGKIDSNELAAAFGVPVRYVVSPPDVSRTVDIVGKGPDKGRFSWSLAADYENDQSLVITPALAKDQWYAASFPPDAFVTPFDAADRIDSVGQLSANGLVLLGLASHKEQPPEGQTLLVYDTPIELLRFPVQPGQTFVSTGHIVNGIARGLNYAGQDTYEVTVDALGTLELPSFVFDEVHRVRTKVTIEPAVGAAQTQLQVSFFSECFGEVARATSAVGETNSDFTQTSELRRLGF